MRLACAAAVLSVLFECAAIPLARAQAPDATLEFSSGSAAAGAGYTWASGTLDYGGESHPFRVNGLGAVDLDVPIEAIGIVRWTREAPNSGSDGQPGYGAQFTQITPEGRQLVYRYVRNREPLFHDDL